MLESNSINKIDMSHFDIEISSDEDEDFITNSNIAGNIEGNPEGLSLLNVLREGTSKNMVLQFNTKIH